MNNFVPKCLGCKQIIIDTYIQALGGHYHKNCFVCQVNMNRFIIKLILFFRNLGVFSTIFNWFIL
jgi:hypothetical protein